MQSIADGTTSRASVRAAARLGADRPEVTPQDPEHEHPEDHPSRSARSITGRRLAQRSLQSWPPGSHARRSRELSQRIGLERSLGRLLRKIISEDQSGGSACKRRAVADAGSPPCRTLAPTGIAWVPTCSAGRAVSAACGKSLHRRASPARPESHPRSWPLGLADRQGSAIHARAATLRRSALRQRQAVEVRASAAALPTITARMPVASRLAGRPAHCLAATRSRRCPRLGGLASNRRLTAEGGDVRDLAAALPTSMTLRPTGNHPSPCRDGNHGTAQS